MLLSVRIKTGSADILPSKKVKKYSMQSCSCTENGIAKARDKLVVVGKNAAERTNHNTQSREPRKTKKNKENKLAAQLAQRAFFIGIFSRRGRYNSLYR
jgi:hypothetical protein